MRPGAFADMVVFDFDALADVSTNDEPVAYRPGVEHVLINRVSVLADGKHTGMKLGRLPRR